MYPISCVIYVIQSIRKSSQNNCIAKKLAEEKRRKKILFSVECARMALAADERRKKYLFAEEIRSAVDARLARLSPSVDDDLIPPLNVKVTVKPKVLNLYLYLHTL